VAGQLSIQSNATLISAGTERMLVDFGKAIPIEKVRQQRTSTVVKRPGYEDPF
jgi:hypothetical protein